jgi:predicted peptidase
MVLTYSSKYVPAQEPCVASGGKKGRSTFFHGENDDVIPIQLSKNLVNQLEKANGNIKYTYYKDTGHDCWTRTYSDPQIYKWLFQQRKK